jgi:hypothetical protein
VILIVTGIVAEGALLEPVLPAPEPPLLLLVLLLLCATGLTWMIFASTVLPLGSSTVTGSPTTASLCLVASRSTVTTNWFDVVCRIAWAVDAPLEAPEPDEDPPPLDAPVLAEALLDPPPPPPPPPLMPPPPLRLPLEVLPEVLPEVPAAEREDPPADPPEVERLFFSSSVSALSSASRIACSEGERLPEVGLVGMFAGGPVGVAGVVEVVVVVVVAVVGVVGVVVVSVVVVWLPVFSQLAGGAGVVVVGVPVADGGRPGWLHGAAAAVGVVTPVEAGASPGVLGEA